MFENPRIIYYKVSGHTILLKIKIGRLFKSFIHEMKLDVGSSGNVFFGESHKSVIKYMFTYLFLVNKGIT